MTEQTKPYNVSLPIAVAIEAKVSAVRKQQTFQQWLTDAALLKLRLERENATQAA